MIFERCLLEVIDKLNKEIDINDTSSDVSIKNQLSSLKNRYYFNLAQSKKVDNFKISQDLNTLIELFKDNENIKNKEQYQQVFNWYLNIIQILGNLRVVEDDLQYFQSLKENKIYGLVYNIQVLPFKLYTDLSRTRSIHDLGLMNLIKSEDGSYMPYQLLINMLYKKIDEKLAVLKEQKVYLLEALEQLIASYEHEDESYDTDISPYLLESLETLQPSTLEKWWLPLLLASQYFPYKITQLWLNRVKIYKFVQDEIVDFSKGLIVNWIVQPCIKIWKTISHSESDSLISNKETLKVEYDSMIRMMKNISADSKDLTSVDEIEQNFFRTYEAQITSPWKHIFNGALIQSVLVLVQRAKVEADFGLNSIDKILQSQQLVFQFVAISPAFLTVWVVYNFMIKPIFYNAPFFAFKKVLSFFNRDTLSDNDYYLIHLNKLFKFINNKNINATQETNSSFIYDLDKFGEFGTKFVPKKRLSDWNSDIFHIFQQRSNMFLIKEELYRLDKTYGVYFK